MKRLYFFVLLLLIPLTYANLEFDFQTPMGVDLSNHIMTLKFGNEFQKISLISNLYELTLPDGTYHFEVITQI